ncbi:MAG: hypothetical protein ABIQ07_10400 [Ginsengibacter sp.]
MRNFNFLEENFTQSFNQWVNTFAKKTGSNVYSIYPQFGTGTFQIFNIERGFQVRLWECKLNDSVELHRQSQNSKSIRSFTIIFYLTPEFLLHKKSENNYQPINKIWNTVLLSNDAILDMQVLADEQIKICSINLSVEWLTQNLSKEFFNNLFEIIISGDKPICIFESSSNVEQKKIGELYNKISQKLLGNFFIHSCALYIINDFFTKLNLRNASSIINKNYNPVIFEIEKKLTNIKDAKLPSLKVLSEEFSMSESTLKRNFKKMYGKNISEYIKEKKGNSNEDLLDK